MAVLNVTGGNFSPKSQKLPFAVNSVDGDNYLLYYSSIGLAGHFPSSKGRGPKLKRSLSNNDSEAENNRLRIPMKGRIQLVINCFVLEICQLPSWMLDDSSCFYFLLERFTKIHATPLKSEYVMKIIMWLLYMHWMPSAVIIFPKDGYI